MNYSIHITGKAEQDLNEAVDYIEFTLLNQTAVNDLLDKTEEEIRKLAYMQDKFKATNEPVLSAWGIRMIIINKYSAFYIVDEKAKTVHILRFLFGKRNWISILRSEPLSLD